MDLKDLRDMLFSGPAMREEELRSQKLINDAEALKQQEAEIQKKKDYYYSMMEIGAMSSNPEIFAKGRKGLWSLIPDGTSLSDIKSYPGGYSQARQMYDGSVEEHPITTQSMREDLQMARALKDPKVFADVRSKAREAVDLHNKTSRSNPKLTKAGSWAWTEVNPDTEEVMWFSKDDAGQIKRLGGKPVFYEDLKSEQDYRKEEKSIEKTQTDIDFTKGPQTRQSEASAAASRAYTENLKEDTRRSKEGVAERKIYNLSPGGKLVDAEGNEIAVNPKESSAAPLDFQRLEKMIFDTEGKPTPEQVTLINDAANQMGYEYIEIEPGKDRPLVPSWLDKKAKYGLVKKGKESTPSIPVGSKRQFRNKKTGQVVTGVWNGREYVPERL